MEPIFENVTVDTEKHLRTLYSVLQKKNIKNSLVIMLVFLAAAMVFLLETVIAAYWAEIPLSLSDYLPYIALVVIYLVLTVMTITRPARAAKKIYLRTLEYYDNSMPPMTSRFFDGHFVSEDVDTRYITPYNKLARVEQKGDLLIFFRKDGHALHVSASSFTKGTLEDFLRFIREKAPQAFPQPQTDTQK